MSSCKSNHDSCIRDIVADIIAAQNEVADANDCVSCESAIQNLLSPTGMNGNGDTTIPFVLYCDCDIFVASGARIMQNAADSFVCEKTPFLKAKEFVDGKDNCVRVELLVPTGATDTTPKDLCDFLAGATGFEETGICITLDLDCFCGINCLGTTTPTPNSAL